MKHPDATPAPIRATIECLETRRLLAWSGYAKLVDQDDAAANYSSITGKGVTVAVIDTGVDYTRPALGGGIGSKYKVLGGYDFYDNDSDPMDESGHGTNTASVVAAEPYTVNGVTYQGVAPDANLIALRVGTESDISFARIKKALDWILTGKRYERYHIKVINLSLGASIYADAETDSELSADLKKLHDLGVFIVAASGNSNDQQSGPISQDGIAYPAADPNVFAVGAVDASDVIPTWSQRGDELDLLAPGVDIVMPTLGGGYVTEDGTSFSSPYVAGTAALVAQIDTSAKAGDIGSILMSSGVADRDGDTETGNTTGLLFSRLDINAALALTSQRYGRTGTFNLGSTFDTALDAEGVLHAAYYDATNKDLLYVTRDVDGKWSKAKLIDATGDVGSQLSIAVDASGKVAIAYYDATNTALKYAAFNGAKWSKSVVESSEVVGQSPSVGFAIDGNAYIGYYRATGGYLKLASLDRDAGIWSRQTVDGGGSKGNVGKTLSLDVGEAASSGGFFTTYDTTVAIAYADSTNGDLKYARLDVDSSTPTWYVAVADNASGVSNIDLNLHAGPLNLGLQAQVSYTSGGALKYAYRNSTWFTETAATTGTLGNASTQLYFDEDNDPQIVYYEGAARYTYRSSRSSGGTWSTRRIVASAGLVSVTENERTGEVLLSYQNRSQTAAAVIEL